MQAGWRIGSVFGIPLYVDSSWFVIVALLTLFNGSKFVPQWGPVVGWGAGLAMPLLLFGSVLLHELGHSLVAKSQGINVNSITLFIFGGIASIEQESKTPGQAFQVAIAGPAVSFGLFVGLGLLGGTLPELSPIAVLARDLATINLVLASFNLIPGLPLDGGQVLKAAVWKITGDRFRGVHWAAKTGKILGSIAIAFGLTALLVGGAGAGTGGLWIALLGWFGLRNASAYDRLTDLQEALIQLKAQEVMTRQFRVVDANMTLREFADDYLLGELQPTVYFAASDGRYRGLVMPERLREIERSEWEMQRLQAIVRPLGEIVAVGEEASMVEAIERLESHQLNQITVLSRAGAVAGIIDRGDIVRSLAQKLNFPISAAEIKRIKEEGTYPPGLQLGAIAKATAEALDGGDRASKS
ncbi:site-2 protease family protein [Oxynema aestuarii]|jgi:Zn-dependent protease/predicted transcriptional regulator|uniref:Zinc metalloprotease n=1 Tax=Oxynema aestuarii AP17 TaxID=2064643 RepID=A0A6H1U2N4_9CYAN|nr:site-2 protease family protein [Oxynema aestuarii]QIZ71879.1 site-2 protease family protein [Oxynema aestuarii AP17]RMH72293.1 MAG: CBS domain-containing protein [Cyanobacteria bacterium J007]